MDLKRDLRSCFAKSNNAKVKSNSQKDKPNASLSIYIKHHRLNREPPCATGSKETSG